MKELLVFGDKTFKISVPDDAKITFGPFSPPTKKGFSNPGDNRGTLRVYSSKGKDDILACFAGINGFRDLSLSYAEEVAKEEGATIWKSDRDGYQREEKVQLNRQWVDPARALPPAKKGKK